MQTTAVLSGAGNDRSGQHQEVIEVQILPQVRSVALFFSFILNYSNAMDMRFKIKARSAERRPSRDGSAACGVV